MNQEKVNIIDQNLGKQTQSEIFEIPQCLNRVLNQKDLISTVATKIVKRKTHHLYIIGAGSSYHAGYAMSYMFNRLTKIPTFTEFSMEFLYLIKPILGKEDCVIAISQSGKTKDTINSIEISKEIGCLTIGITNNLDSDLTKICDFNLGLNCKEEESVLATKTYVASLAILAMLSLEIARENKTVISEEYNQIWVELVRMSDRINSLLPLLHKKIKKYVYFFKNINYCFILGSGPEYATAMEAALKLKEGSRIFGQAYSTAEFPHGPITLADSNTGILAIIPYENDERKQNLLNLLKRLKERKAIIIGIYEYLENTNAPESVCYGIEIPNTVSDLQPILMILAIQLLTLELSRAYGINCDTPKFLTKVMGV